MEIRFVCKECNELVQEKKEESTENWKVYETVCKKCGGQIAPKI